MVERLVVPLDRSAQAETALEPAAALAAAAGASLELVVVSGPDDAEREEHRTYLDQVAARLPGGATTRVVTGADVAGAILAASGTEAGGMVCMSTHGRSGVGALVLGSVSEDVVRRSHAPVLLVGPRARGPEPGGGTVVVGLDGSDLAEAVLPAAATWAKALGGSLWLCQVAGADTAISDPDVLESGYLRHAAGLVASQHDLRPEWDVVHGGDPADALVDVAQEQRAALVALSTHGRTGVRRVALGSVAMRVAHRAPCPLLVYRSEAEEAAS